MSRTTENKLNFCNENFVFAMDTKRMPWRQTELCLKGTIRKFKITSITLNRKLMSLKKSN